jgi:SAM-dependent methyltransferase
MSDDAASFIGSIPQHYDQGLGPLIFVDYAADIARRVASGHPTRVLETAAGTGIVTRKLRDALSNDARLTATDLNPPMLEVARAKFRAGEQVEFQPADATALPFADGSFDAVMCQFGIMFFPDKAKSLFRGFSRTRSRRPLCLQRLGLPSLQSVRPDRARSRRSLFPCRSAAVLQRAVLLPSDRSDQGIVDRG